MDKPILNRHSRRKLEYLEKMADHLREKLAARDPSMTKALKLAYGKNYFDAQSTELAALDFAIKFIKENSTETEVKSELTNGGQKE